MQTYLDRLRTGHGNNYGSNTPGILVYVTQDGLEEAKRQCKEGSYSLGPSQIKPVNEHMTAINLHEGVYITGLGRADFYKEAGLANHLTARADGTICSAIRPSCEG